MATARRPAARPSPRSGKGGASGRLRAEPTLDVPVAPATPASAAGAAGHPTRRPAGRCPSRFSPMRRISARSVRQSTTPPRWPKRFRRPAAPMSPLSGAARSPAIFLGVTLIAVAAIGIWWGISTGLDQASHRAGRKRHHPAAARRGGLRARARRKRRPSLARPMPSATGSWYSARPIRPASTRPATPRPT